jgi:PhnB protein
MAKLNPYLTFAGNCREAMAFYQECLGGELELREVDGTPFAEGMPAEGKKSIMHSSLTNGDFVLFASDMLGAEEVEAGNAVNLCLNGDSEEEIRTAFAKLSEGGKGGHEIEEMFWGALYGDLTDKYGFRWMFSFDKNQK